MAINFTSPVVGAAVAGFTSPTYTLTSDTAPSQNGKQYAITALGGTQTGVEAHSVSKPFTSTFFRPATIRTLPAANPLTGVIKDIPVNAYALVTRKGANPAAGQVAQVMRITTKIEVQSGSETYEPEDVNAMLSAHFGILWGNTQQIADAVKTGVI